MSRTLRALTLLLVAGLLLGCRDEEKPTADLVAADAYLSEQHAPGPDWRNQTKMFPALLGQTFHLRHDNVPKSDTTAMRGVTWNVPITDSTATTRCNEAAAWLTQVGESVPGSASDGADAPESVSDVADTCVEIAGKHHTGATGSYTFGGYPNTVDDNVTFGPFVTYLTGQFGEDRILAVAVVAAPAV